MADKYTLSDFGSLMNLFMNALRVSRRFLWVATEELNKRSERLQKFWEYLCSGKTFVVDRFFFPSRWLFQENEGMEVGLKRDGGWVKKGWRLG